MVTSEHCDTGTILMDSGPAQRPQQHKPRCKIDKANRQALQNALPTVKAYCRSMEPLHSKNLDMLEAKVVNRINWQSLRPSQKLGHGPGLTKTPGTVTR